MKKERTNGGVIATIFPPSPSFSTSRSRERNPLLTLAKRRLQWPETAIKRFVGRGWAVSSLLSPPRSACLHFSPARDFIRPQCREIKPFWDIYEWIGHTDAGPAAHRNKKGRQQRPLRQRARFATCCQTRRSPVLFRSTNLPLPPSSSISLRTSFSCSSLRYCLWNSSNEAG